MTVTKPSYYDRFRCIAGACPDSCCKEWEIVVDDASAERWRAMAGPLGDSLRTSLREEDGLTLMTIRDGRCPMWRSDGLCRIHAEAGEGQLCDTCRDFPRLKHDYGDFLELGLELSCPEAARLILTEPAGEPVVLRQSGEGEGDYDREAMAVLLTTRQRMLELLADESRPVKEILALALLYGCQAQSELDGEEPEPFDALPALETARELARPGTADAMLDFLGQLELLSPDWGNRLKAPVPGTYPEQLRRLARYFVERYWLQAVSDYDLYCRVKLMLIACITVNALGGDLVSTAQRWSKEIENNTENLEALLDAAYSHPAFTDDKLLGLLLG